jgi:dihydrofolate synthase/folylpolyglutamate synthase
MNKPKASHLDLQLAELYGRINYERQSKANPRSFKLRNMREFLSRLGDPHLKHPVIHVAGTKGKGSVSTMIGQILSHGGYKTGVYTSPHLETIHQRMAVDGELISDDALSEVLTQLQPVLAEMDSELELKGERPLTFFEVITATTFQFFANQKVDAIVLEVGLGGRLDSTNVCEPSVCVITNISLDHTKQLGDTVDKIAYEKAGIIKSEIPVISGALDPLAADVIATIAKANRAPLFQLDRDLFVSDGDATSFTCHGATPNSFSIDEIKLRMPGDHQRSNSALAVAVCQALNHQGWTIPDTAIRKGLNKAQLAGRTEVLPGSPTIILDMAHNGASVEALVKTLTTDVEDWVNAKRRRMVIATTRDKDMKEIMTPLIGIADEVILTKYQKNPRGKSVSDLIKFVETEIPDAKKKIVVRPTPEKAWQYLRETYQPDDVVCFAGSAFLIAEARPLFVEEALDTDD